MAYPVKRTSTGKFRVWGNFLTDLTPRVWVAVAEKPMAPIEPDTILTLRDAGGLTIQVMAGEPGLLFHT